MQEIADKIGLGRYAYMEATFHADTIREAITDAGDYVWLDPNARTFTSEGKHLPPATQKTRWLCSLSMDGEVYRDLEGSQPYGRGVLKLKTSAIKGALEDMDGEVVVFRSPSGHEVWFASLASTDKIQLL